MLEIKCYIFLQHYIITLYLHKRLYCTYLRHILVAYLQTHVIAHCLILMLTVGEISSGSPLPSLKRSDVSISLSPSNSLPSNILVPLKNAVVQNNTLKRLLEECTKKVKDREVKLQQLQTEKNDCATLEEETLRPQVTIII